MNANLKQTLKNILVPRTPQIILILVLLLITTGLQALMPWPFKILLDNVLGNELLDTNSFVGRLMAHFSSVSSAGTFVVVSYLLIVLVSRIADYIYAIWNNRVIQNITRAFAGACFDNLAKLDYGYFRKKNVGSYIYKLNSDVSAPAEIIESSFLPIIASGLYLIVTVFILGNISVPMAGISLITIPLLSMSLYFMNKRINTASTELEHKNGMLYTFVDQVVSQLKIIQAYTQQQRTSNHYDHAMWKSLSAELRLYRYNIILTLINGLLIGVTYTTIIGMGIRQVNTGTLSSGLLIVFIFYLDSIVTPVISIIGAISSYKQSAVKLKNTADIFDPAHHLKDTGTRTTLKGHTIQFADVGITDEKGRQILDHISFTAKEGVITAIIGKSGSGKSSLFHLLLRLTDKVDSGKITVGGYPLQEYTVQTLRNHIAYVPQETELFDEKIADIISFGKSEAPEKEIKDAAALAQADTFIARRPEGYDSRVGEGGNMLSGGERQRLLLARAYLRNPDIFLLDEIFSAQDVGTQGNMMKALREVIKNKTILLITHTYTILAPQDYVIVIDKGKIVAEGTFAELQKKHKLPSLEVE